MKQCIQVVNLSKAYRHRKPVVKSISFDVAQAQIFAFLGPNGAGKSTTMGILSTLLDKTDGSVRIDGLSLDGHKREIKQKIGVVFQSDVLDEALTVRQNLVYRGGLYYKNPETLRRRIEDVSRELSIQELMDKKYAQCSGGQRRIVQIARALLPGPKLLILDEPTTGLDPVARRTVWQTLLTLRQEKNMTIFYTTHYMEEALYADRYCILSAGRILQCDSIGALQKAGEGSPGTVLNRVYCNLLSQGEQV